MDITEQEAKRIFNFIVKKLGYDHCRTANYGNPSFQLIATKNNKYYNYHYYDDVYACTSSDDGYDAVRITGNSWTDMLKKVIQCSTKSYCYIYGISSFRNKFIVPKTLEELRIIVDLES